LPFVAFDNSGNKDSVITTVAVVVTVDGKINEESLQLHSHSLSDDARHCS